MFDSTLNSDILVTALEFGVFAGFEYLLSTATKQTYFVKLIHHLYLHRLYKEENKWDCYLRETLDNFIFFHMGVFGRRDSIFLAGMQMSYISVFHFFTNNIHRHYCFKSA